MPYFKDWIKKFQIIQKDYKHIVFRIVRSGSDSQQAELNENTFKTRLIMGDDCEISFEDVDKICATRHWEKD